MVKEDRDGVCSCSGGGNGLMNGEVKNDGYYLPKIIRYYSKYIPYNYRKGMLVKLLRNNWIVYT